MIAYWSSASLPIRLQSCTLLRIRKECSVSILQKSRAKASARQQINIRGVNDGVLMLTKGRFRVVLEVSSINFELKSEDEQDALIDTYESFLNSLPCPLQIIIRIRELDMDNYLADL